MDEQGMARPAFDPQLPDRLQKGLRFNIADRAADLDQGDIGLARALDNTAFYLIGNMRDHLHRGAQIIAAPFLIDHILVNAPGGVIIALAHAGAHKALIMAEVQVRLRAVMGHIHLAMLKRAHGAGVDIDIRVQFQKGDLQAARLQDRAQRGGGDPLAERRDHAAGNKDITGHPGRRETRANSKRNGGRGRPGPVAGLSIFWRGIIWKGRHAIRFRAGKPLHCSLL